MHFVQSMVSGLWRLPDRHLIRALEHGSWCLNFAAVDVLPGLVVSSPHAQDAEYFLATGRAALVEVDRGQPIAFATADDAAAICELGLARPMSGEEIEAAFAAAGDAADAADDDRPELDAAATVAAVAAAEGGSATATERPRRGRPKGARGGGKREGS